MPTATNPAPFVPLYRPSMAASFMGWNCATLYAEPSPVKTANPEATSPKMAATRMLCTANSRCRLRSRNQLLTPTTNTAPKTHDEVTVCRNLFTAIGESATAQKSNISLRTVSGLNCMPTGYCIHALATRIHSAERVAPMTVSHVEARCMPRLTLPHPKYITATNVASMKKATMPSMASGAPKMSPTNQL